jgi:hypothetical protein
MADKTFLLRFCRHYKGQKHNPDPQDSVWRYELFWVEESMKDNPDFSRMLDDYIDAGLAEFNAYDNTPVTLKAVLYNRFMQQAEGMAKPADFKCWYDTFYTK